MQTSPSLPLLTPLSNVESPSLEHYSTAYVFYAKCKSSDLFVSYSADVVMGRYLGTGIRRYRTPALRYALLRLVAALILLFVRAYVEFT